MGTRERRDRAKQETRAKIVDAARELFNELGYQAFTMRALADRIEYTPTAIYHHFENKEALVNEICQTDFGHLAARFQSLANIADPIERIRGTGETFLEFALTYPNHYRFMFMSIHPPLEHPPEYVAETHGNPERDAYAFFVHTVEEAIRQGRLRPEFTDAHQVVQMLWAALHGLISLRLSMKHERWVPWRDLRTTAQRLNELMLAGFVKAAVPGPASV